MINNFDLIKKHLHFRNNKSFYFIQIIKRRKENPNMHSFSLPVESFYIFDIEHLERLMPHIIEKCEQNRARAYIKMNSLDMQNIALETISIISKQIQKNNWKYISKALNSACGKCDSEDKLYLIDIDSKNEDFVNEIIDFIDDKVKMIVPTKNGYHLLASFFDIQHFKETYKDIDVHSDGITLLYFPNI